MALTVRTMFDLTSEEAHSSPILDGDGLREALYVRVRMDGRA